MNCPRCRRIVLVVDGRLIPEMVDVCEDPQREDNDDAWVTVCDLCVSAQERAYNDALVIEVLTS